MTAKEAFEEMIRYCDSLSKSAEILYRGERKAGVLAGIKMIRSRLVNRLEDVQQEELPTQEETQDAVS